MKRSYFTLLIGSYFTLLLMIIITFVLTVFFPFSRLYKSEIKRLESQELTFIARDLKSQYIDLASVLRFNLFAGTAEYSLLRTLIMTVSEDAYQPDAIFQANKILNEKLNSLGTEKVSAIEIYNHTTRLLLSSQAGAKILSDDRNQKYRELDWLNRKEKGWIGLRTMTPVPGIHIPEYPVFSFSHSGLHLLFSGDYLSSRLKALSSGQGILFVLSDSGGLIAQTSESSPLTDFSDFCTLKGDGKIMTGPGGERFYVSKIAIEQSDWVLYKMTSVEIFYKGKNRIHLVFFLTLLFIFILGGAGSYFISRSLYKPIGDLTTELYPRWSEEKIRGDEISAIDSYIRSLSKELRSLENVYRHAAPLIRNNVLRELFTIPCQNRDERQQKLNLANLKFPHRNFRVLILQIRDDEKKMTLENKKGMIFSVLAYAEGRSSAQLTVAGMEIKDNTLALLFNYGEDYDFCSCFKEVLLPEHLSCPLCIGVGPECINEGGEINDSCLKAEELLDFAFLKIDESFFFWEKWGAVIECDEGFALKILDLYKDSFKRRDWNKIKELLDQDYIFFQKGETGMKTIRHYCMNLVFNLSRFQLVNQSSQDKEDLYGELQNCPNLFIFKEWFKKKISVIEETLRFQKNDVNSIRVNQAKEYLIEHLQESITLQEMARRLSLTPEYFSRIFKQETGENYTTFMTELKLLQAREYLLTTKLSIKEITAQIGYSSTAYFDRKFKEQFGMTPIQYRVRFGNISHVESLHSSQ